MISVKELSKGKRTLYLLTAGVTSVSKALLILEDYNFKRITHPLNSKVVKSNAGAHAAEIQILVSEGKAQRASKALQESFMDELCFPIVTKINVLNNTFQNVIRAEESL